ncbi:MAG: ABC transporter permease, partial [Bryobacteraceae bacterium]
MAWTSFRNKLAFLFKRSAYERELAEELESHRQMWQEEAEQAGLGKESASMSARKAMGNSTLMSEESRSEWLTGWLDALAHDVRYCLRGFARHPGFTGVALLTLALGIGANTAIFRLVDAILLRALPVQNPRELVAIGGGFSYPRFEQIRDRQQVLTGVFATHALRDAQVSVDGRVLGLATCELVSGNYFQVLGVNPISGRPIVPDDDKVPESSPVAVISHGFWKRAFGMSPDVLGRKLQVQPGGFAGGAGTSGFEQDDKVKRSRGEVVLTIVGVAPPEFFGETVGTAVDVWTPMMMQPAMMPGRAWLTRRSASWVRLMGRLRPGAGEEPARAALNVLFRQVLTDEIGSKLTEQQQRNIANARLNVEGAGKGFGNLRREFSQPLLVLMAVVGLVLLIACLNIANLLLARATARRREMAMRLSLGASRGRLLRQLFTESLVLAGAGGVLGILLAFAGTRILVNMVSSQSRPILLPFEADWRILGFTAGLSLLSGILFGIAPAVRGTSGLHGSLKDTARSAAGGRNRTAKALVAVQVAVSVILLVGAGLFLRTLYNLKTQNVGYERENLLVMRLDPIGAGYRGDDIGRACVQLMQRIAAIPGVRAVTFSENGLFSGTESGTPIEAEGFVPASREDRMARFDQVGPGYFTHVGIPLMLGRDISERDAPGAPRVAVINDTMARFYFKNASPIGKRISVRGPSNVDLE